MSGAGALGIPAFLRLPGVACCLRSIEENQKSTCGQAGDRSAVIAKRPRARPSKFVCSDSGFEFDGHIALLAGTEKRKLYFLPHLKIVKPRE